MLFKGRSTTKRGPSWLALISEGERDEQYWSLDYPLKLSTQFGEVIYIRARKQFLITGAKAFEHILKTHHHRYKRAPFFYQKIMFPFFGDGILTREDEPWKNRRRAALPFYQQNTIKHYTPVIVDLAQNLIQRWKEKLPKSIDMLREMNYLNLRIVSTLMFSQAFEEPVLKRLERHSQFCNFYCAHAPFRFGLDHLFNALRFRFYKHKINRLLLEIIEDRRKNPTTEDDLLQRFFKLNDEETQTLLNDHQILDELRTHIFTGHETTACTLSWMWYLLALNPEYQLKLEAELDQVLQGRTPTWDDIPHLTMTRAIILETSRLYPVIWTIPRTNLEADTLLGVDIPKGSTLLLHIYSLHRNPDYWDNPNSFRPERFLEPTEISHPFAYLPFGAGPHMCIASHLAPMEMILLTATLAQNFRFTLAKPFKMSPETCISLRPQKALKMIPTPR